MFSLFPHALYVYILLIHVFLIFRLCISIIKTLLKRGRGSTCNSNTRKFSILFTVLITNHWPVNIKSWRLFTGLDCPVRVLRALKTKASVRPLKGRSTSGIPPVPHPPSCCAVALAVGELIRY